MELELWHILVLAVIQGVTEFLPISSSGHLVIVAAVLSPQDGKLPEVIDVSIVLHLGTLGSILVYYWQRVWRLLGEDRRTIGLLIVGTLPAVAVGLPLEMFFRELLESPLLAGCLLPITGIILLAAARLHPQEGHYQELSYRRTLVIGLMQAVAILPGISRSGTTISTGLAIGLSPRAAATFSFLLAIPALSGAGVLQAADLLKGEPVATPWQHLLAGAIVSFIVGLCALAWLVRWLEKGRLQWFAWWCIPVGIGVVVWQVWMML